VTLVHKGNIMKFTEGAFRDWGYQVAQQYFGAVEVDGGLPAQSRQRLLCISTPHISDDPGDDGI